MTAIRWTTLTLDCSEAGPLGVFYSRLLGWDITARDGSDWIQLRNPEGGVGLNIQADCSYEPPTWPEQPGRQAKMMHLEVLVDDLDAAVRFTVECGGAQAPHQPADRDPRGIRIMLDPAGHPFACSWTANDHGRVSARRPDVTMPAGATHPGAHSGHVITGSRRQLRGRHRSGASSAR